ncbi:MAG: PEP/pyruvate-binding domain-containing protein [archaeon]
MRYIVTLTNVSRADADTLGYRAADLGILKDKGFNIPLSFVVNNEAFQDFLAENHLKAQIDALLKERTPREAYLEIIALFGKARLNKDLEQELSEAYESLNIEPGSSASSMVSMGDHQHITLIRSPAYLLDADDDDGIFQNIKGSELLAAALRMTWCSLFSPEMIIQRQKEKINSFNAGIIVQKMKKTKVSVITYSISEYNDRMILVKSFLGLQDYGVNILGKDLFEVDPNSLAIKRGEINNQEFEITRLMDSDELGQRPLLNEGAKQKLNEKLISESARLTKRAKSFIGKDVKMYLCIQDEIINIVQVNRMTYVPRAQTIEKDEITMSEDEQGNRTLEHSHEFTAKKSEPKDEKFTLPGIMSSDEAKEAALKTAPHRVFSLEGFEEKKQAVVEVAAPCVPAPKVEIIKETSKIDEEIAVEENLLEQVLKIKEITERMEEHALNSNKEAYSKEAKQLREMISKVRKE